MKNIVKDTFVLFAITLIAGLGLGVVYNVTLKPRNEQEEKTRLEAYEKVMPGLGDFEAVEILDEDVNQYIAEKITTTEKENNISTIKPFNASVDNVVKTFDKQGNEQGYIVTMTDKEAYDGSLQIAVGILSDGTVKGISFLSLSETPGLGMRADEDMFKNQFQDKNVPFFVYSKNGKSKENEIDAISSATVTSNAVTHAVNGAICCVEYITGGGH